jgi:glycosyltransferase involved in cell wall biosynthesis
LTVDSHHLCVIIPVYNHYARLTTLVGEFVERGYAVYLIDDGSDAVTKACLAQMKAPSIRHFALGQNTGKGAAVCLGLAEAHAAGFSHVLQIDADGQHHVADAERMINHSKAAPEAVVAGSRIYGDMPKGRRRGRRITDFWVNINTLSASIEDSMCGLRVYPLSSTMALLRRRKVGSRMQFDTDIAVYLFWQGTPFINVTIDVEYSDENNSHFKLGRDNLRISLMHAKHFLALLVRLPLQLIGPKRHV